MVKGKIFKYAANVTIVAAIATMGISIFKIGSVTESDPIQEIPKSKVVEEKKEDEDVTVDAGTYSVEADNTENLQNVVKESAEEKNKELLDENKEVIQDIVTPEEDVILETVNTELNFSEDTVMEWPVHGNILIDYSMDQTTYFPTLDQYRLNPGICVQAVENAPVVAAVSGKVFSINTDARTGTTLTMELGNGYQAIYGQLKDLKVKEGEEVKKGTTIGYVNAPTKYYSLEGSNLYFAMKKNAEPIDPIVYLP